MRERKDAAEHAEKAYKRDDDEEVEQRKRLREMIEPFYVDLDQAHYLTNDWIEAWAALHFERELG